MQQGIPPAPGLDVGLKEPVDDAHHHDQAKKEQEGLQAMAEDAPKFGSLPWPALPVMGFELHATDDVQIQHALR
jgi:hypothetical protein